MAEFKISAEHLLQIKRRQWQQRWGREYVAAIFADPKEAPGISTGTVLRPLKFEEREFHALSDPETFNSLLALYHPDCWEIHEQRVLFPTPRPHFLYGHPRSRGERLGSFAGTLDVADRMGILPKHPRVRLRTGDDPRLWPIAPFPYIGDLLLFMTDPEGVYCVNWPVKNKVADFRRRGPRSKPRPTSNPDDPTTRNRQELERIYYADAGIRTVQVALEDIPQDLRINLRDLFIEDSHPVALDGPLRAQAIELAREFIGRDVPAYVPALRIAREFHVSHRDATALIHQGIWRRQLRIDLFRPFLMDKPLRPEVTDVLMHYADRFKR